MNLGAFSLSLAVKNLGSSNSFYEKLGFVVFGGDETQNRLIMKNGNHCIGLFQGMFDKNTLTFNPGWDQGCGTVEGATDVRQIAEQLRSDGLPLMQESLDGDQGPGSFVVLDPDGNPVLIDQHV